MPTTHTAADGEFCEIGVSAVTVQQDGTGETKLFCSKRSSAALRSAMSAETSARKRSIDEDAMMVESEPGDDSDSEAGVVGPGFNAMAAMAHQGSIASRMRRDCKRALEQRRQATLCGDTPMLLVRLIGRAVRINGAWYSICSFCATFFRIQPHNRIDAEIACLQCCETFWRGHRATAGTDTNRPACRFCKKVESGRVHNYATYHSPKDVYGPNAQCPPPLRMTTWCPAHDRPWLRDALSTLSTPQVLAHIAVHARPVVQVTAPAVPTTSAQQGQSGRSIASMQRRANETARRKARKVPRLV